MSTSGGQKIHVPLAYRKTRERCGWCAYALKTLASFGIDGGNSPGGSRTEVPPWCHLSLGEQSSPATGEEGEAK